MSPGEQPMSVGGGSGPEYEKKGIWALQSAAVVRGRKGR
jgi:hypothetical protein